MSKNKHAVALGKKALGKPKTMTPAALAARLSNLVAIRRRRLIARRGK